MPGAAPESARALAAPGGSVGGRLQHGAGARVVEQVRPAELERRGASRSAASSSMNDSIANTLA